MYAYMRYAESKLREEEQRAQKYLETSLCTTVNSAIPISVGPAHTHPSQHPPSNNPGIASQQPVIANGGGVVAAGIGTANGLNATSTSGSVQNLVDSCVVSTYEKCFHKHNLEEGLTVLPKVVGQSLLTFIYINYCF